MFSTGMDSAQSLNAPLMIPTRFVWPHGGRRVFLTGSFTRWSDHLPMSPMEDCPTVFQSICNLTPGLHQYKFYVDGEWRHDENQPFVSGNYGIVNSLVLTGEPASIHSIASPGIPGSRSSMEVDNENFHHAIILSDCSVRRAVQKISEADLELSRRHISMFLSTKTSYDLLPDSGKVIALDVNLPVKQAFHILYEQEIPVAPLWDLYCGQFVGMLTALDFILILRELGNHGFNLSKDELETHTISAWKLGKRQRYGQLDVHGKPINSQLVHAGPYDTLKDVAIKIVQNGVAMIPIVHSSSTDGLYPQLLHLTSLSEILRSICTHFQHSCSPLPLLQQPIHNISLGSWAPNVAQKNGSPLAMLRPNASIGSALSLLVQGRISSIPIVDDNNVLLDTYSRSDITALAKDSAYEKLRLDEMSIRQARLGKNANSLDDGLRCQTCYRSDSLLKVMEMLSIPGVRRVIVVGEGSKRVEGIISLSDLFRFLLG